METNQFNGLFDKNGHRIEIGDTLKKPDGKIVKNYLKVLKENTEYPAWTINDKLEVVKCIGMIANDGSWNYHNNYDDSEDVLYVIENKTRTKQWFSLNKDEVIEVQKENILKWKLILEQELSRLQTLTKQQ